MFSTSVWIIPIVLMRHLALASTIYVSRSMAMTSHLLTTPFPIPLRQEQKVLEGESHLLDHRAEERSPSLFGCRSGARRLIMMRRCSQMLFAYKRQQFIPLLLHQRPVIRLNVQAQQWLSIGWTDVEPPVAKVNRD